MSNLPGWNRQTLPKANAPFAWLQWKGSNICADVHCPCGTSSHIDQDFVYYLRCPGCEQVYMLNGHVEMVPVTPEEVAAADLYIKDPDPWE